MACAKGCCPSQAEHYRSLVLSVSENPSSRRWDRNMQAYRTARDNGGQPPSIDSAPEYLRVVDG